jgi:hypothetical protein
MTKFYQFVGGGGSYKFKIRKYMMFSGYVLHSKFWRFSYNSCHFIKYSGQLWQNYAIWQKAWNGRNFICMTILRHIFFMMLYTMYMKKYAMLKKKRIYTSLKYENAWCFLSTYLNRNFLFREIYKIVHLWRNIVRNVTCKLDNNWLQPCEFGAAEMIRKTIGIGSGNRHDDQ